MKAETYTATIYCGLKRGYTDEVMPFEEVESFIQDWVDRVSQCVSVTRTEYIYRGGREPGIIVGFINYPRFPSHPANIEMGALELASELLKKCKQMRLSIVFPDETIMLSNTEEIERYTAKKSQ
jgi:hypothetical protein